MICSTHYQQNSIVLKNEGEPVGGTQINDMSRNQKNRLPVHVLVNPLFPLTHFLVSCSSTIISTQEGLLVEVSMLEQG